MKIYLLRNGEKHECVQPYFGARHVLLKGDTNFLYCPKCGKNASLHSREEGAPSSDDKAVEAPAHTACCGEHVGTLRVETGTLFGVREDAAVLSGRWRVY